MTDQISQVGLFVMVHPPAGMSAEEVRREVWQSIEFGKPQVLLMYVKMRDQPDADPVG